MIATRYAPVLCVLVGLALIPTVIHSYMDTAIPDGRTAAAIPTVLAGFTGSPTARGPRWGDSHFESADWFERRYVAGADDVILTVIRTFDLKRVYHHPEIEIVEASFARATGTERLASAPSMPVHVLRADGENAAMAMYVLQYGDRFIDNPLLFQVRTAGELLVSGRRPITLFFAHGIRVHPDVALDDLPATRLLLAAIAQFATQTLIPGASQ